MRILAILAVSAGLLAAAQAQAAGYTFTTIDNPADPTFNQLLGINNAGLVSGYFGSGQAGHPNQGYTIAPPYTSFASLNVTASVQTQDTGVNANGVVTGFWSPSNTGTDAQYGFVRTNKNGHILYLDVNNPSVAGTPPQTQVLGVNINNIAVGFYNDSNGAAHGFSFNANSGVYAPVTIPAVQSLGATGINNSGLICGFYIDGSGLTKAFLKPMTGGTATKFLVPGAAMTQFLGVNSAGEAVGFYQDANNIPHGLLYNPANGQWQTVDNPNGAGGTVLNGLNDNGQMVGFFTDAAGNVHGMLVNSAR